MKRFLSFAPRLFSFAPRLLPLFSLAVVVWAYSLFVFHGFGAEFPPGLNNDAAWHGLVAFRILEGEHLGIYLPESFGHETPYYYVMAAMFRLRGSSKTSIELTSMLFGYLSTFLFYGLIWKRTKSSWLALGCSLLWISSSAFVVFSRVGWQLITLVPASLMVAGACRFYLDDATRRGLWAAVLGISGAFTLYTYNGGRAILAFLPLFWALRLLQEKLESRKTGHYTARETLRDAAVSAGVFLVVAAPMLWYAAHNFEAWNGRAAALISQPGGQVSRWQNLKVSLGYFHISANGYDFITDFPVLEGPMLGLLLGGVVFALLRIRTYWPELLLLMTFLLPGIVTQPSFHRAVGTLPIVYLLSCWFLLALFRWFGAPLAVQMSLQSEAGLERSLAWGPRSHWLWRWSWKGIGAALFALLVAVQMMAGWRKLYVEKQPFRRGLYPEATQVGEYLQAHSQEDFVIYAGNWPIDTLKFLSTTDMARPGANLFNYQAYNTPSHDGLPEMALDFASGKIARPVQVLVEPSKVDAFINQFRARYRIREVGQVPMDGPTVAHLFEIR